MESKNEASEALETKSKAHTSDIPDNEDQLEGSRSHTPRDNEEKREACRNFLNNRCFRGALCKFDHPNYASQGDRSRSRSPVSADKSKKDICRDFLRNLCKRGYHCRFYHPTKEEADVKKSWFTLCIDFQNGKCTREDCRFFHISVEDEEHFRQTGEIAFEVIDQAMQKAINFDIAIDGSRPMCRDYLKGYCHLQMCRFRHVSEHEYEDEIHRALYREFEGLLGTPEGASPVKPPFEYRLPHDMPYRDDYSPSFNDFIRESGPSRRDYYDHSREQCTIRPREPLDSLVPWEERETLRPPYRDIQSDKDFDMPAKDEEISYLKREIKWLEDQLLNKQHAAFDDIKHSNDKFIRDNAELQDKVRLLERVNEKLNLDILDKENWVSKSAEMQIQIEKSHREIQELKNENSKLKTQLFGLENQKQSVEKYECFMKEQMRTLINNVHKVENELSSPWGGGPLTNPSFRNAWSMLKSTCSYIGNNSCISGATGNNYNTHSTNGTNDSSPQSFGRSGFNSKPVAFQGSGTAGTATSTFRSFENTTNQSWNAAAYDHDTQSFRTSSRV